MTGPHGRPASSSLTPCLASSGDSGDPTELYSTDGKSGITAARRPRQQRSVSLTNAFRRTAKDPSYAGKRGLLPSNRIRIGLRRTACASPPVSGED